MTRTTRNVRIPGLDQTTEWLEASTWGNCQKQKPRIFATVKDMTHATESCRLNQSRRGCKGDFCWWVVAGSAQPSLFGAGFTVTNLISHAIPIYPSYPLSNTVLRRKMIVAMTGAMGAILRIEILLALRKLNIETHIIISKWAEATIKYETDYSRSNVRSLADHVYTNSDQAAATSSGSFSADGMIIVPCSMKTLASLAVGYCDDLISRAGDVVMKGAEKIGHGRPRDPA
jgi:Flavoprotein